MRVLFVSHHLKGDDGWSRYAKDLIAELQKNGVETMCLVNEHSANSDFFQKVCLEQPLRYIANPFLSLKTAIKINRQIKEFSPDIIHFLVEPYATTIPFLRRHGAKLFLTVHSTYAFMPILVSGWRRIVSIFLTRAMFRRTEKIISVSEYTRTHLMRNIRSKRMRDKLCDKISILSGGVSVVDEASFTGKAVKTNKNEKKKNILFVGAVKPRKGLTEAVNSLALVKSDFIFQIVGYFSPSDKYYLQLKDRIKELNIEHKICFTGVVTEAELNNLYGDADLFLMLSTNNGADFEGYGLVYLEANLRGVPCIGPNDSGAAEAIVDGQTGYVVNQYDNSAVAEKIDQILSGNVIFSANCQKWAIQNSSRSKSKIMLELYNEAIKKR